MQVISKIKDALNKGKIGYLAKNSLFFTISSFGTKILSFFLVPLYTSVLTTSDMGLADIVVTTSSLLFYAVTLCVGDAVFIFAIDKQYQKGPVLKYGIVLVTRTLGLFSFGLLIFAWINPIQWPLYCYGFLWFHLILSAFTSVITSYLRAIDRIKEMAVGGVITTAATIASNLIFLLVIKMGLTGYMISITIGLAAGLFYYILKCDNIGAVMKGAVCDKKVRKSIMIYSLPLVINGVSWWINGSIDHYFVSSISGMDINGIYSISYKIPTILSMFNAIFSQAWTVSAVKEYDKEDEDGFFGKVYTSYNAALIFCSFFLILTSVPLARLLYAKDFFVAWKSSAWLIVSVVFSAMAGFVGSVFGAVKNSKAYAISTVGAAAVNIVLNLILIPQYQDVGAAIATAVSFAVLLLVRYLYSRRFIRWRINLWRDFAAYGILVFQVIMNQQEGHHYLIQGLCLLAFIILYFDTIRKFIRKIRGEVHMEPREKPATVDTPMTEDSSGFRFRDNAFDVLRMVGAYIVVLSHSFRWFDIEKPSWLLFFTNGSVGVMMFFAMTGYMVMAAYERSRKTGKSIWSFYWNRIIRIYPALILSFVFITVINALMTNENIFSLSYLKYSVMYCVFARGGGYGATGLSNGVLWTITVDILFYIFTPLIYKVMHKRNSYVWLLAIGALWLLNLYDTRIIAVFQKFPVIGKHVDESFPICFIYELLIGSFLYFKREKIIQFCIERKYIVWALFAFFIAFYLVWDLTDVFPKDYAMHAPQMTLIVCPLTIILAYALGKHRIKNEISYGVFLYHILVVQVLMKLGVGGYTGIFLVAAITTVIAFISKKVIEDPCLKLKR